jgi:hypothetical protein
MNNPYDLINTNSFNSQDSSNNNSFRTLNDDERSNYDQSSRGGQKFMCTGNSRDNYINNNVNDKRPEILKLRDKIKQNDRINLFDKASAQNKRYQKSIESTVSFYSGDRDINRFIKPNNYIIALPRVFTNIESIELISAELPNAIQPVNINNNKISWKYMTLSDFSIQFNQDIEDYSIENFASSTISYDTELTPGYYSVNTLKTELQRSMNAVESVEGFSQGFNIDIDVDTHAVTMISRKQALKLSSISIDYNTSDLIITPVVNSSIDITWQNASIMLTDFPDIGGISNKKINNVEHKLTTFLENNTNSIKIELETKASMTDSFTNLESTDIRMGKSLFFILSDLSIEAASTTSQTGVINSILSILGFPLSKSGIVVISEDLPCRPIHKNTDYIFEEYEIVITNTDNDISTRNRDIHTLNIQQTDSTTYIFRSELFLFLRLALPGTSDVLIGDNMLTSETNSGTIEHENIFYIDPFQSTLDEEDKFLTKDTNDIFGKIILDPIPGNISSHTNNMIYSKKIYYNIPLRNLESIKIQFISPGGRIVDLKNDHGFTLKIIERQDVLEDSLMDSQSGDTITSGININKIKIKN